MNKSNYVQTGGYPLKGERLQELQTAYSIFNSLGNLAGNFTIISGCEVIGENISSGFVHINGEIYEFRGGYLAEDSKVIIIEEPVLKEFENGEIKTVHVIRYATFGVSEESWNWSDFKRPMQTKDIPADLIARLTALEKKTAVFKPGFGMVLFQRPAIEIPEGWAEVVNWRGRIPVGLDESQIEFNLMGKNGGGKSKTLTIAEIPEHDHGLGQIKNYTSNYGVHGFYDRSTGAGNGNLRTDKTGGGQAFSILNPYRVVMFIEFIG